MRLIILATAVACLWATTATAQTLIISDATYSGPILDLSNYTGASSQQSAGPLTVGNFTFIAQDQYSVVGDYNYGLSSNGQTGGIATYVGTNNPSTWIDLLLNTGPVNQLGFYFNYAPNSGTAPTISALDQTGNVFASFNLASLAPISTPGAIGQFEFRGITDNTASIYGLRLGGSFIVASGSADGSLVSSVPEPETWAMMLIGFGGIGFAMRRRRREEPSARFA